MVNIDKDLENSPSEATHLLVTLEISKSTLKSVLSSQMVFTEKYAGAFMNQFVLKDQ